MLNELIEKLKREGKVKIEGFGTFELLPRRKGKTFVGFHNIEGKAKYSKRVKFTSSSKLRDRICK